jgi:RNA polymerase sigma factor (sigma-70 family)
MSAVDTVALVANTSASDGELVDAVQAGDEEAFEELFRRYHGRVRAFVSRRVADHGRAEELTQDVFVSALRHLRVTGSEIAFKPWLFQIARNATIDLHRRSSRAEEVPVDKVELIGSEPPETEVMARERLAHLQGAFGELNEVHHRALVMRELEGRSYREIGERLSLTQAGVEGVLFRARRRLAKEYRAIRSRAAALLPFPLVLRRFAGGGQDAAAGQGSNLLTGPGGQAGAGLAEQAATLVTAVVLAATGAAVTDRDAPGGPDTRPAAAASVDGSGQARTEILGHRPRRAPAITDTGRRPARRAGGRKRASTRDKAAKPRTQSGPRSGSPGGDAPQSPSGGAGLPQAEGLGVAQPAEPAVLPSVPRESPPLAAVAPALPDPQPQARVMPLLGEANAVLEAMKGTALSG